MSGLPGPVLQILHLYLEVYCGRSKIQGEGSRDNCTEWSEGLPNMALSLRLVSQLLVPECSAVSYVEEDV